MAPDVFDLARQMFSEMSCAISRTDCIVIVYIVGDSQLLECSKAAEGYQES